MKRIPPTWRKKETPVVHRTNVDFCCLQCKTEIWQLDGAILKGCEHFEVLSQNAPYLKNRTTDKKPEKLGGVRF